MFPLDYALAVALITTPNELTNGEYKHFQSVIPTVQAVAIYWELLDKREEKFFFQYPTQPEFDLSILRRRHEELWDAPRLNECLMFPDVRNIADMITVNRDYLAHLRLIQNIELVYQSELRELIAEVEHTHVILNLVCDAHRGYYYTSVRRSTLKKLRTALGFENYYQGKLPSPIPVID